MPAPAVQNDLEIPNSSTHAAHLALAKLKMLQSDSSPLPHPLPHTHHATASRVIKGEVRDGRKSIDDLGESEHMAQNASLVASLTVLLLVASCV
jgi:hypothetical protein